MFRPGECLNKTQAPLKIGGTRNEKILGEFSNEVVTTNFLLSESVNFEVYDAGVLTQFSQNVYECPPTQIIVSPPGMYYYLSDVNFLTRKDEYDNCQTYFHQIDTINYLKYHIPEALVGDSSYLGMQFPFDLVDSLTDYSVHSLTRPDVSKPGEYTPLIFGLRNPSYSEGSWICQIYYVARRADLMYRYLRANNGVSIQEGVLLSDCAPNDGKLLYIGVRVALGDISVTVIANNGVIKNTRFPDLQTSGTSFKPLDTDRNTPMFIGDSIRDHSNKGSLFADRLSILGTIRLPILDNYAVSLFHLYNTILT